MVMMVVVLLMMLLLVVVVLVDDGCLLWNLAILGLGPVQLEGVPTRVQVLGAPWCVSKGWNPRSAGSSDESQG